MRYNQYFRMMVVLLVFCGSLSINVSAETVSEVQVRKAAETFITKQYPAIGSVSIHTSSAVGSSYMSVAEVRPWTAGDKGTTIGYVVDLQPSGYILMRLDDNVSPIKLYSDKGFFTNLPPVFLDVMAMELGGELKLLSQQQSISTVQVNKFKSEWNNLISPSPLTAMAFGDNTTLALPGPLLTTTWNQDSPYNYYAPSASGGPGGRAYAGCVATAMSQILRFHEMPVAIASDFTYIDSTGVCQGSHSASDVGLSDYDWGNMPNSVYAGSLLVQQQAVAKLMYHCGVTVRMDYEATGSGAYSESVPVAFRTYYNYNCGDVEYRSNFSDSQWYSKIAADIAEGRPLYYGFVNDANGGHAVVCDGAKNGDEIHINFGWGGVDNAWYNMDNLNGFNNYQEAVFGIQPDFKITTETMPDGVVLEPYSKQLEATNGVPPYTWSVPDKYYEQDESNSFSVVGSAQGWSEDDGIWQLDLPFSFPFFGQQYSNCWVDSNGKINFDSTNSNYVATEAGLISSAMIAVLWDDLRTDNGYDIYVDSGSDKITVRWHARYFNEGAPVNIAATLYKSGAVRLSYGSGNIAGGIIGVSSGDGEKYFISRYSASGSMDNAGDIIIQYGAVFPAGLELSGSGLIFGTPMEVGTNLVRVMATDTNGARASKSLTIVIGPNQNDKPIIDYTVPAESGFSVPENSSAEFRVIAHDPEGSNLTYRWVWNDIEVPGNQELCTITNTGSVGTRQLVCCVADDVWTNNIFAEWDVTVLADTDSDSIPDQWELQWFTNLTILSEMGDYDNDGLLDGDERIAGTCPTNQQSLLAVTGLESDALLPFTFQWNSVSGRFYSVYSTVGLMSSWSNTGFIVEGDGTAKSYTNNVADGKFFRIDVELK